MAGRIPVYEISLPEYTAEREPDYTRVGLKLDRVVETHLPDRKMAIRGIGLIDHPGWSLNALVQMVLERGADRYDPEREGVNYPDGSTNLDIYACTFAVVAGKLRSPHYHGERCPSGSVLGEVVGDHWGGTLFERGFANRLDLLLIYDLDHLEMLGQPQDRGLNEAEVGGLQDGCLFRFRYPERKSDALLGIVKILRE